MPSTASPPKTELGLPALRSTRACMGFQGNTEGAWPAAATWTHWSAPPNLLAARGAAGGSWRRTGGRRAAPGPGVLSGSPAVQLDDLLGRIVKDPLTDPSAVGQSGTNHWFRIFYVYCKRSERCC